LKVLGGKLKGRNFFMPAGIRPTQSITRKALFDMIGHDQSGVKFLDLFAGSGAVGIEAYSLGAEKVVMVERSPKCLSTIRENLSILGIAENDPEDRMPPPPAAPLTPAQINKIYKWISQGALNNYCEQLDCDSLNVSFSVDVFPVIQNTCLGCHSGSNPNGGILLTNYQQIKSQAAISAGSTGSLIGAITWDAGNTNMPYNGARLSDCDIGIIRNWITVLMNCP